MPKKTLPSKLLEFNVFQGEQSFCKLSVQYLKIKLEQ